MQHGSRPHGWSRVVLRSLAADGVLSLQGIGSKSEDVTQRVDEEHGDDGDDEAG